MKFILCAGLFLSVSLSALAFQWQYGDNVIINRPVHEDLYIAGGTVIINAPVYGDLVVAGGTVTINDTVTNDILAAGGNISFNGYVGDDIRCAGGNLHILKNVTGDVVITGGTILIDRRVTIGGLIAGGGRVTIDGTVAGIIKSGAGEMVLNGAAMKSIDSRGGNITINGRVEGPAVLVGNVLHIGDQARFGSDVRYWARDDEVDFKQSLGSGRAVYDPSLKFSEERWYFLGASSILGFLWYVGMALLMITLIQYLFSGTLKRSGTTVYYKTLRSLGYGLLFLIAVPIAAVVAFITIIGVPVGLLLLVGYITVLLLITVITSLVAVHWLNNAANRNWRTGQLIFGAFGIFVVLKIISFTPFLGWLVMLVMACIAFGAILLNIRLRKRQTDMVVADQALK